MKANLSELVEPIQKGFKTNAFHVALPIPIAKAHCLGVVYVSMRACVSVHPSAQYF